MKSSVTVDVPLNGYAQLVKRHWVSLFLIVLSCSLVGVGLQARQGTPVEAHQRVFVRDIRNGDTDAGGELATIDFSLDTEAQLIRSDGVIRAIQAAAGTPMTPEDALSRLRVTALPNTRILALHVTLPDEAKATLAVQKASKAYLRERYDLLSASKAAQLVLLQQRDSDITKIVSTMNKTVPTDRSKRIDVTKTALGKYNYDQRYVETTRIRLANNRLDVGELVGETSAQPNLDGWVIKGASGIAVGLAIWFFVAVLFDGSLRRISPRRRTLSQTREAVPVIGRVHMNSSDRDSSAITPQDPSLAEAVASLRAFSPISAVLAPLGDVPSLQVAAALDGLSWDPDPGTSGRVVLVTPPNARVEDIKAYERRSAAAELETVGLIVVRS
ncbi:MAG: hypothetical protein ABI632_13370 [Pseudolysinimonas sp.]